MATVTAISAVARATAGRRRVQELAGTAGLEPAILRQGSGQALRFWRRDAVSAMPAYLVALALCAKITGAWTGIIPAPLETWQFAPLPRCHDCAPRRASTGGWVRRSVLQGAADGG
jgi:hypothetical protein